MIVVTLAFGLTAIQRTNRILDEDSDRILNLTAEQSSRDIDDILSSVEQSVGTIYNYAEKRAETYENFLEDEEEREQFNYDISELGKSIAEKTPGAISVYLRYNPEDYEPTAGFWYTYNVNDGVWDLTEPTDIDIYDRDDLDHVGWYYIPVETGEPFWMDPYYNENINVEMISYIIPYIHDGYTVGVIGMDIDIRLLRNFVSDIIVYDSGRAYLVSSQGDIVFHFDYPEGVSRKDLTDNLLLFVNSVLESSVDEVRTLTGIDGVKRKIIQKRLSNGMILGLNTPVDEINVPQSTLTRELLIVSILILVMAIAICLSWIRTLISPLKRMTQVAEHYANGDYSDIMNTDSADEIGILSRSLETMSTSLKKQIEIADTANRKKSVFLANMSHEIRTPINAILGFDEMILRESSEKAILSYAANIKGSGQTLLALINEILDFSKIESGKLEIIPVNYDTAGLINDMLDMIEFRALEKKLAVNCHIDRRLPSKLCGDDIRIREILTNLLTNAVKYTEAGSVTLSIHKLSANGSSVRLHISVSDTGIGVREEDKEHLWDSFQRLDEKHNRGIEGTGLGLAISSKYLELMGSRLQVESTYGQGSDFYFDLEQEIIDPKPIGDFESARKANLKNIDVYRESFEAPEAHILVVDDVDLNQLVIKGLLKNTKIRIDTADSGKEAIEKIRLTHYDLILLDHMMPEMDGIETLAHIRSDERIPETNKNIPVIALTANAISGAQKTYLEHGFSDYLSKPVNPTQLEKLLVEYLPEEKIRRTGDVIDMDKGLDHFGGEKEIYETVLKTYVRDNYAGRLQKACDEENWKEYETVVHAVKSSSQTIGALRLSELAMNVEYALKTNGDIEYAKKKHNEVIRLLNTVTEEIEKSVE